MASNIGSLAVFLTADTSKFKKGMGRANKSLRKFAGSITAIAGLSGAGILALTTQSLRLFQTQENAEKKLGAVLKATGFAAGFSLKEMKKYASGLQSMTGMGDEVILGTQAIIATFKGIKGDAFKEATVAALDMAAVMGTDAKSGAIQLGKALNDPTTGISSLTRVGVVFTKQQKEQIKNLQKSGDLMGAQAIILKELKSEFGGAAAALNNPWKQMQANLGDSLESVGNLSNKILFITDTSGLGLSNWIKDLTKTINDNAFEWALTFRFMAIEIKTAFMTGVEGALFLWDVIKTTGLNIADFIATIFSRTVKGFKVLFAVIGGFARDVGTIFSRLGKEILNALTFKKTDFKGVFSEFGTNLRKAITEQRKDAPIEFDFKEISSKKFIDKIGDLQIQKNKQIDALGEEARKRRFKQIEDENRKKGPDKPPDESPATKKVKAVQQRISNALVRGSIEAFRAEKQSSLDDKILKANMETAKHTKTIAENSKQGIPLVAVDAFG